MNKLEQITEQRQKAHARLMKLKSKVYLAFLQMERAAFSDGELTKKHRAHCRWHLRCHRLRVLYAVAY
jgi:hypothetical protein